MYTTKHWNELRNFNAAELINTDDVLASWLIFERYWNGGSPSGFNQSKDWHYSPFSNEPFFSLASIKVASSQVTVIGKDPLGSLLGEVGKGKFRLPCHPDLLSLREIKDIHNITDTEYYFVPTASGRTVVVFDNSQGLCQLKLHYPLTLGRFQRDLFHYKWHASIERSQIVDQALQAHTERWGFYSDGSGHYFDSNTARGFGNIIRPVFPQNYVKNAGLLVPGFSLFAHPVNGNDTVLQALSLHFHWNRKFIEESFLTSVLDLYLFLAIGNGVLPEINAQNIVFEINKQTGFVRPCIRDMQDTYLDEEYIQGGNYNSYKFIRKGSIESYKRRSFSFDFKLLEYFLFPLAKEISRCFKNKSDNKSDGSSVLRRLISDRAELIESYFIDDLVYSYPKSSDRNDLTLRPSKVSPFRSKYA